METLEKIPFSLYFCAFLIFIYALQIFTGFDPGFQAYESSPLNFFLSFLGHSDAEHLFNNIFFIGLFGTIFELLTSRKTFIYTFLASAIFANFTAFIFYTDSYIIGASGGAMGVLSALAVYRPRKIGLALGIPVPMYVVLAVYIMINLAGVGTATGTAYEAHLFGLLTGTIIGIWLRDGGEEDKKDRESSEADDRGESNWEARIRRWEEKHMM